MQACVQTSPTSRQRSQPLCRGSGVDCSLMLPLLSPGATCSHHVPHHVAGGMVGHAGVQSALPLLSRCCAAATLQQCRRCNGAPLLNNQELAVVVCVPGTAAELCPRFLTPLPTRQAKAHNSKYLYPVGRERMEPVRRISHVVFHPSIVCPSCLSVFPASCGSVWCGSLPVIRGGHAW